jgi:diguanylate cyclase (GGDEF)-like protein/PAS domain S-box-containing protein
VLAVVATAAVIELRLALGIPSAGSQPALTLLLIPIILSASLGGLGPGLTATFVGALGSNYFILPPRHSFWIEGTPNLLAWLALVAAGVLVSELSELLLRARYRAEANAARLGFLVRAGRALSGSLDYARTLQSITGFAVDGAASFCTIHVLEDGSPKLAGFSHVNPRAAERIAEAERFLSSERPDVRHPVLDITESGRSLFVPLVDEAWIAARATSDDHARFMRELNVGSLLSVPLTGSNATILGALTLARTAESGRRYDESDLALAEEFARRSGAALENARNFEHETAYRRIIETTNDGVLMLDHDQRITYANDRIRALLGYDDGEEIVGRPLAEFLDSSEAADAPRRLARRQQGLSEHSELCFRRKDGSRLWTIAAATPLAPGEVGEAGGPVSLKMVTDITERKRAEAELAENERRYRALAEERHHAAYHDPLTGLPNRVLFVDRLGQALVRMQRRKGPVAAILFLDIDRFKIVNDSLGHAAGDELLTAFAERLAGCLRPYDLLARLGGDEFTILLDDVRAVREATHVAERILESLEKPFSVGGHEVAVAASIGIALAASAFEEPETILRDADTAMYRAKELGRGRYELFAPELHSAAMARLELEIELRRSLERGELWLAYQPIVALETGRITGFEALARWQHPERGAIPPSVFIPLAEETGLILPLGAWVLGEACRQARGWRDLQPREAPISVNVNVSAKQLATDVLGAQVARALAKGRLSAEHLHLEITESVLMSRGDAAEVALNNVRSLGVSIQLDDFGTGYSSLSYLQQLPISTVKIDRSFVSGLPGAGLSNPEIVGAIVGLAQSLGMTTTAEGVETAEQLSQLRALKCTSAQGYHLSRPLDEAGARAMLKGRFGGMTAAS